MIEINFPEKKEFIYNLGKKLFDKIVNLPKSVRQDDQERTGIHIVARKIETENLVRLSVYKPSDNDCFFAIEQTVRCECDMLVTNSACISYSWDRYNTLHLSVYGLKPEENVSIAIIILSKILELSPNDIIYHIGDHAIAGYFAKDFNDSQKVTTEELCKLLPSEIFDKNHYLYTLLEEYQGTTKVERYPTYC